MSITTCTKCAKIYEERSGEAANEPSRLYLKCHHEKSSNDDIDGRHFDDECVDEIISGSRPMTAQEREFLVLDTPRFEECQQSEDQLRAMDDKTLMKTAFWAWVEYTR